MGNHTYENCHNITCRRKCQKDGYNMAIDEFAEKIRDWKKEIYTNERYAGELDFLFKHIDEIASQMKGEKEC